MRTVTKQWAAVLLLGIVSLTAAAEDFPGSEDHPLITRYPGSDIAWFDVQAYAEFAIATGPVTGYRHIDDWMSVEGRLTRIYYVLEGERSVAEVYANYLKAVEEAGFEVFAKKLYSENSRDKEIGSFAWLGVAYADRLPNSAGIQLLQGSATIGGSAYVAAKLTRPQGDVYLTLGASQYKQDMVVYLLDIIEVEAVEDGLVTVDADAMSKGIDTYGKIALYGIFFDYDKATIKEESKEALEQIAVLLKNRPGLQLYVVGHTDMKGSLDYNIDLSSKRAAAVVEALTKQYGIASSRLLPQGVGPLVPVMNNQGDKGRAKNRRVELVER